MYTQKLTKKICTLLALAVMLMTVFAVSAFAAENVNFAITVDPASLPEPGQVTVSIRVVNAGDTDMTEPVLLYDPDGNLVTGFGDGGQALIKKGDFVSAQHTYAVTQEQLDEGKLTYSISYNEVGADGAVTVKTQTASAEIAFTGVKTELTVNRTIDPEVVRNGKNVTVMYELYNGGNVEITSIRVREDSSLSRSAQTVTSLQPGERTTVQFTATMGSNDMISKGTVTYKANGKSLTEELPEVTIARAKPGLVLDNILTADKTSIGKDETVTLTLTIQNTGNISYNNVTVTDATYGEIFTNLSIAPGETLVREKQFLLNTTTNFKYSIVLPDNTGTTNTVTSNEVKVSVYDPSQVMHLSVTAETDSTTISRVPADVKFRITVTNNGSQAAKNVAIYHGETYVYTFDSIAPGAGAMIERDFTVSQAGKFRFTARVRDALDNTVSFDSADIQLTYAAPTPAPTTVPVVTVKPLVLVTTAPIEVLDPVGTRTNELLKTAATVLAALFAVAFVLFVVVTIARKARRNAAKNAIDTMERAEKRDYRQVSRRTGNEISDNAEEEFDAAQAVEASRPSDEMLREEAVPVMQQETEDGGYHLTREEAVQEAPAAEETPRKRNRRSGRKSVEAPSEDE